MARSKMTWTAGSVRKWLAMAVCFLAVLGLAVPVGAAPQNAKLDAPALAKVIDQQVQKQLMAGKVEASPLADDAEFLRRVYLDIIGVIPPADKAAAFLSSTEADKRAKLIDELLGNSQYGKHMADTWHRLLVTTVSDNRRLQIAPLVKWLEQ